MLRQRTNLISCCFALLFLAGSTSAEADIPGVPRPANPFLDPQDDWYNPLRYIASNVLTGVAISLYLLSATLLALSMWKWGARWMAIMVFGAYTFSIGLGIRFGLHSSPENTTLYIVEYLFTVLSPCAFLAGDYILLSHLSAWMDAGKHLFVSPRKVAWVFVISDISTFCIQASGGGMSTTPDEHRLWVGSHIFLAGLAAQLLSFTTFTIMFVVFLWRIRYRDKPLWDTARWNESWKLLSIMLLISCAGIMVRSVYRTIELSQGFAGYLATHEKYFYGCDTYPLYVAITVYVFVWPGRILTEEARQRILDRSKHSGTSISTTSHNGDAKTEPRERNGPSLEATGNMEPKEQV